MFVSPVAAGRLTHQDQVPTPKVFSDCADDFNGQPIPRAATTSASTTRCARQAWLGDDGGTAEQAVSEITHDRPPRVDVETQRKGIGLARKQPWEAAAHNSASVLSKNSE